MRDVFTSRTEAPTVQAPKPGTSSGDWKMSLKQTILITGAAALTLSGCADLLGSRSENTIELEPAFQSVPFGFSSNANTFDAAGDVGPFFPGTMDRGVGGSNVMGNPGPGDGHRATGEKRDGFGGPGLHGILMGGGLGPDFLGRIPFGRGKGRGPFGSWNLPDTCTFDAGTGVVTCPDKIRDGLTVKMSFVFKDTTGTAQPKFDTLTTNSVNSKILVNGTKIRRDSSTSVIDHASDRTVGGLAPGSTSRRIDGTAHASETTTGVRDDVPFVAVRLASDTTSGLIIPIVDGHPTIPSAGVVIRTMSVTITPELGTPKTRSRREQITFDGTNVIQIMITTNGETKNCTITLPSRKLVCE
jgi:hypothetical protein